ncbi:MAG: hypothetical protein RMJ07_07150 [Nitrososphaerota archaeon]|nr:hypothetical protein [Candidatus Bathyarchaeota archaeon]MDW8049428.1 hypothetical protein [Nitrososphaerota archaeon]
MPKLSHYKYFKLGEYLAKIGKYCDEVTLSFSKIEEIIGQKLPGSAGNKSWWKNSWVNSHSKAWMTVGWHVSSVDPISFKVKFEKDQCEKNGIDIDRKRRRDRSSEEALKMLAYKVKLRRRREPSKTRIAMAQARLKNIERKRLRPKFWKGKKRQM